MFLVPALAEIRHTLPMVYIFVLFGSLGIICAILGARVLARNRSVRKFVRSIHLRIRSAEERGAVLVEETVVEKPKKNPRASAVKLQEQLSFVRKAERQEARGDLDEAEKFYIKALTVNPHAPDVKAQLAKLYLLTNRDTKAEAMYRELILQCDDVSFYANLGLACYRQGKFLDSCHCYQEALNRDPQNPERCAALGKACIAARHLEEAAPLLERAISRLTRDTELMDLLAECYLQLEKPVEAETMYRAINKIEPYNEKAKARLLELAEVVA